jgi:hypothetical protein
MAFLGLEPLHWGLLIMALSALMKAGWMDWKEAQHFRRRRCPLSK